MQSVIWFEYWSSLYLSRVHIHMQRRLSSIAGAGVGSGRAASSVAVYGDVYGAVTIGSGDKTLSDYTFFVFILRNRKHLFSEPARKSSISYLSGKD